MIQTVITLFGVYTLSSANRLLLQQYIPVPPTPAIPNVVIPNVAIPGNQVAPGVPQFEPVPLPHQVPQLPPQLPPQVPPQLPPQVPPQVPTQVPPQLPPQVPPQLPPQVPPQVPPQTVPQVPYVPPNGLPGQYAPPPFARAPAKIECKYPPPDPQSCSNKMTTVQNPDLNFEVGCVGLQGCQNSRVNINYDQFASPMLEEFKGIFCKNEYSCLGAVFQFVNNRPGDKILVGKITCDKPGACMNAQFILGSMMELEQGDMFCSPGACGGCVVKESVGDVGKPCWEYTDYV